VDRLAAFFDVEVFASRLNFYRDGTDWKPFHHDSHAFGSSGLREDFTMGASFGDSRSLAFLHQPSGSVFALPQENGDVFAFTSTANRYVCGKCVKCVTWFVFVCVYVHMRVCCILSCVQYFMFKIEADSLFLSLSLSLFFICAQEIQARCS
jgi:hypothetical protein